MPASESGQKLFKDKTSLGWRDGPLSQLSFVTSSRSPVVGVLKKLLLPLEYRNTHDYL